ASNFIVGKQLVHTLPPFALSTGRFAVAFLCLLPIYLYNRARVPAGAKTWLLLTFLGFTGVFAFNTLLYTGLKLTSAVNATLINAFNPTLTVLLSLLILREKPFPRQMLALVLSFIGVAWIAIQGQPARLFSLAINPGDLIILFGALVWAVYSIGVKKAVNVVSALTVTTFSMMLGLVFLLPATYVELSSNPIGPWTWQTVLALLYLGVFPSVLGFLLWNRGIGQVGPAKAAMFYNLIPPFAALMNYLFLAEIPKSFHIVGGLLVLWGVYLGTKPGGKPQVNTSKVVKVKGIR
ncbi:MAG: DMT family transporter, partial [Carboxydocellales bacterium]